MKEVLGVGVIGYGPNSASRTFHVPLVSSEPRLKLEMVSSLTPEEVRPLLPGVRVVGDANELISNPKVGLVVVAVPNTLHFKFAKQAIEAGKHVVAEKPLCVTAAEVDELITLAAKHDVLLSQFHNRRWDGAFLTMKKLLAEDKLGEAVRLEENYGHKVPLARHNWREADRPGSGVLYDLGVHMIDQAVALFGRPAAVSAKIERLREGAVADDQFEVALHYGGKEAVLRGSFLGAPPGPRYFLKGSRATYQKELAPYGSDPQAGMLNDGMRPGDPGWAVDTPEQYGTLKSEGHSERVPTERGAYEKYYAGIAAAILDGAPQPVPAEDARDVIAIIEAAFMASGEGRKVEAKEIGFRG